MVERLPFHDVVLDAIWGVSKEKPGVPCFISAENLWDDITYAQLYTASLSFARFFRTSGLQKGEIFTISLLNTWHFFPSYVGSSCVGGVTSGMSPESTAYEMEYQLENSQTKILLTTGENLLRIAEISGKLPFLKIVIYVGSKPSGLPPTHLRIVSFDDIISEEPIFDRTLTNVNISEDLLALPYSSGTTGLPKGVMITHSNFLSQMVLLGQHSAAHITPYRTEEEDSQEVTLQFLPFYHAYGFTTLCGHLLSGTTIVIFRQFKGELFLQTVEKYKIKHINMVPMLFNFFVHSDLVQKYDLSSVVSVASGGAPLSQYMIDEVKKKLKNLKYIIQGYGMTEIVSASHLGVLGGSMPPEAIGQLIRGFSHKIVDPQTGRILEPGEVGELCVRGPTLMKGYWRNPQATREAIDDEGFLHTGDIGSIDENGFLYLKDRIKELIKVKGFQVAPAELENLLLTHPKISDVAVIGIPFEATGEAPRAFVVRKDPGLTAQEVKDFIKERVSSYKELTGGVEFTGHIPRNPTGKILRRKLKADFLDHQSFSNSRL
ncbi:hypothetical protein FO519_002511 [Halicephalobus sp. NKZ332]|nr:hypothetical protein FO519_002511 [Halicephalobus sp. NKZ332]